MEKTPKIRFAGFADAWEQRKLEDVLKRRVEQRQQSEEYPRLAFASGQGVIPLSERKTNNREQLTKDEFTKKYLVTELDDIVYNPANVKYGAIDRNKCGRGLISPIYVTFTTSEIPGFIERIVTSHDFQQRALKFEEGTVTKRQSVNPEDFVTIDILVAPQKEEQRKISEYFDSLDHLITLHQRKCDLLKKTKKYMLQKMFPKKGDVKPEIRFVEFTDAWEQRKVSDLLQERNEQTPMSEEYPLMAFVANQGVAPKGERYDRSALVNDEAGKKYKRTEYGDFIYSSNNLETGSIGLNKYGNACISPVYSIFKPIGKADLDFLGRRFLRKDFINEMVKWRQGVVYGQWKIHESDFLNIEIAVPSVDEQKAIGQYFDNLDNLITLHQRKLKELKEYKKWCLKNMFV